jgi:hypothetical protein
LITAQILWASARAARSHNRQESTPGAPGITKGELLAALLDTKEELSAVFEIYNDLEAAANDGQEITVTDHGIVEQMADATVRAFRPWWMHPFDDALTIPDFLS